MHGEQEDPASAVVSAAPSSGNTSAASDLGDALAASGSGDTLAASGLGGASAAFLFKRVDWPQWLIDAVDYLQELSIAETWLALLVSFVKLEKKLKFTEFTGTVSNPISHFDVSNAD